MKHPETRMTSQPSKAVTYARVSSAKQVREGHGLASQETRCREFARHKGYEVIAAFQDDITGKSSTRPGLAAARSVADRSPPFAASGRATRPGRCARRCRTG